MTIESVTGSSPACHVLSDVFSYFVQIFLGVLAFSTLVIKRYLEHPRRTWGTFFRDSSKQAVGAVEAHIMNMGFALVLNEFGNECKWYFINFMVDCLLGLLLNLLFLRALEAFLVNCCDLDSEDVVLRSGHYGVNQDQVTSNWVLQTVVWMVVVALAKAVLFWGFVVPLHGPLYDIGDFLISPMDDMPRMELVFVMIIVPVVLNIFQFWVQDSFLMASPERAGFHQLQQSEIDDLEDSDNSRSQRTFADDGISPSSTPVFAHQTALAATKPPSQPPA